MGDNQTSRTIKVSAIIAKDPCPHYRNQLTDRFGDGEIEVTEELCMSQANDWDWGWAGVKLLPRELRHEFNEIENAAYDKRDADMRPIWDMMRPVRTEASKIFEQVKREADANGASYWQAYEVAEAAYDKHMAVVRAAEEAALKMADQERNETLARAFATLFLSVEDTEEEEEETPEGWCETCGTTHDDDEWDY